jgi:5-methyltetrahydrofolate--homocysteine methyltransferase
VISGHISVIQKKIESIMKKITDKIKEGLLLVSDGAWGTFLYAKGLKAGECPEKWNLENPDAVFEIAESYIKAGSDMIETNSFGGNKYKLQSFGLEDKVHEINRAAAQISRKAAGPDKHVIGSMGPTGKMLMMGDVTADELYDAFKEQAIALEEGGADALVIETMFDLEEAKLAIKAAKENTKCEVICTMTFENAGDSGYRTMMGTSPSDMLNDLKSTGVDIVGANCGNGMCGMIDIVKEIRATDKAIPVLIHANAGVPELKDGETVFRESPDETAGYINELLEAGANIVGGCCGTTPQHIEKITEIVKDI